MTEIKERYSWNTDGEDHVILCKCGFRIGRVVYVKGLGMLEFGTGMLFREVHGVCPHCHHQFHWAVTDQLLEKILARKGRSL